MNPHSHDYRDTVRAGEKTGSAYQTFRRARRPSAWLWFSTGALMAFVGILICVLPWEGGW